jgi:hypothetical protein
MDFLVELFRNFLEHQDQTMSQACTDSYTKTLKMLPIGQMLLILPAPVVGAAPHDTRFRAFSTPAYQWLSLILIGRKTYQLYSRLVGELRQVSKFMILYVLNFTMSCLR